MALTSNHAHSNTQSVLHFAKDLQHAFDQPVDEIPDLATHLNALAATSLSGATREERSQLHQIGVRIWNKCRHDGVDESSKQMHLLAQSIPLSILITLLILINDQSKPLHTSYSQSLLKLPLYVRLEYASMPNSTH
jgi:hypothetical protein